MRYRKRPVVIEAFRLGVDAPPQWWSDAVRRPIKHARGRSASMSGGKAFIHTLEGTHRANPGDWIIKGVKDEMYPCRHDIFLLTYEEVTDA